MTTLFTVLQVLACLILITAVLFQPSKGGAALGGSAQSVFGSSGATSFLFKMTMWMAAFIVVSSLYLSRYRIQQSRQSVINSSMVVPAPQKPQNTAPVAPGTQGAVPAPVVPTAPLTAPVNTPNKTVPPAPHK